MQDLSLRICDEDGLTWLVTFDFEDPEGFAAVGSKGSCILAWFASSVGIAIIGDTDGNFSLLEQEADFEALLLRLLLLSDVLGSFLSTAVVDSLRESALLLLGTKSGGAQIGILNRAERNRSRYVAPAFVSCNQLFATPAVGP